MPGDETYIHLIDVLVSQGPLWLFVAGVLILSAFIAVKLVPVIRESIKGKQQINQMREERKAEEARMRDERDREHSANSILMVDAMNNQSEGSKAIAAAINALTIRIDNSQSRSEHMGMQVEDNHEMLGSISNKVNDIHRVVVQNQ